MDEKKYKVVVIGDAGVGKTALTFRFCEGKYRDNLGVTIGVGLRVKSVLVDNETVKLNLWDTAGMEGNQQALGSHYYHNANAVVIVYDTTNQLSFQNLDKWLDNVSKYCSEDIIKVLVGTKCDQDPVVNRQDVQKYADSHGLPLFETSAKLDSGGSSIDGLFLTIAHKLKANRRLQVNNFGTLALSERHTPATHTRSCC